MDYVQDVNDPSLKPRLLRLLLRDYLPNQKRPLPSPSHLLSMISIVKTHGLLKETIQGASDNKLVEEWKCAVDAWLECAISLVSSSMLDKQWMGTCLLGITFEECRSERITAGYSDWFQKLLEIIQMPCGSSHIVKEAACSSLSDLLTRLATFANKKKDATSLAVKLIQPVLLMLQEVDGDALWVRAIELLCTAIIFFPSAVRHHYDKVEACIVSKIMSGRNSTDMSKALARCLALLPRARGDESSWFTMMQKILMVINMHLDDAFEGLKQGIKSSEIMSLLFPGGKDPPPPLGGYVTSTDESLAKKLQYLLVPRVSSLMQCLCEMLTYAYPVQVTVPIHPLLGIVERVLLVDGSLPETLVFTTALQQELLCSELPALHLSSLDLLISIIKGVKSQLLPHAAKIVHLIREYFWRATFPSVRIKVYSIMQILLVSMGAGMAQYLARDVIENAFVDLGSFCETTFLCFSNKGVSKVASEVYSHGYHKKRKHNTGLPIEDKNTAVEKPLVSYSVQLAALGAIEDLLKMGGSINSECWRSDVDLLLITVATNVCVEINFERSLTLLGEPSLVRANLQLAALRALLASLLSPGRFRPAYLSQGLEIFRRGKQESGTEIAAFCAHALSALEVLIHPRALPMIDLSLTDKIQDGGAYGTIFSNNRTSNFQFATNNLGGSNNLDVDDKDNDYWLEKVEDRGNDNDGHEHFRVPTRNALHEKSGDAQYRCANVDLICENKGEDASEPPKTDLKVSGVTISAPNNEKSGDAQHHFADVDMIHGKKDEDHSELSKTYLKVSGGSISRSPSKEKPEGTSYHAADVEIIHKHEDKYKYISEPTTTDLKVCEDDASVPRAMEMGVTPSVGLSLSTDDLPPGKEDVPNATTSFGTAAGVSKESLYAAVTRVKERLHYESDSSSLDSIPDIVNIEPDSD